MTDDADEPSLEEIMGDGAAPEPEKKARAQRKPKEDEVRLHPILSNEDVLAARAKAKKRVEDERRAAAMAELEKVEVERLRVEEGFTTGVREMDELVSVTIDLAPYTDKIVLNGGTGGNLYHHGHTYQIPRHVADTLAEIMSRSWKHEDQVDGKSIAQSYGRKRETIIHARTGSVQNAPARFDA